MGLWQDMLEDKINWLLLDWGSGVVLTVVGYGTGGFAEMKAQLDDSSLVLGGFRVMAVYVKDGVRTVKPHTVGFLFMGLETKSLQRDRFLAKRSKSMSIMSGVSATLELVNTSIHSFTMKQVAIELISCCGNEKPTQYEFGDGGIFFVNGDPNQSAIPSAVTVSSPFNRMISVFDTGDLYSDLTFVIPNIDKSLQLHRMYLGRASMTIEALFKGQESPFCEYNQQTQRLEWKHKGCTDATYRDVLVKMLRFCYGEDQVFKPNECAIAMVLILQFQLQHNGGITINEKIKSVLKEFMVNTARNDVETGAEMLYQCAVVYEECKSNEAGRLDEALAKIVLSQFNMRNHSEIVIDRCLMQLPPTYLDIAQFSSGPENEFHVRLRFIKYHDHSLSGDEKRMILEHCDQKSLHFDELIILYDLGMIQSDALMKQTELEREKNQHLLSEATSSKRIEFLTELDEANKKHQTELEETKEKYQSELEEAMKKYQSELEETKKKHQSEIDEANKKLEEAEKKHQSELAEMEGKILSLMERIGDLEAFQKSSEDQETDDDSETSANEGELFESAEESDMVTMSEKQMDGIHGLIRRNNNTGKIKDAIGKLEDVNVKEEGSDQTPLHVAAQTGNVEVCRCLLDKGADLHAKDDKKNLPIHIAAFYGNAEVVDLFASLDPSLVREKNVNGNTPMHCLMNGRPSSSDQRANVFKVLQDHGADVNETNDKDDTVLQLALMNDVLDGSSEMAKGLIDSYLSQSGGDSHRNKRGESVVYIAAYRGNTKVVRQLCKNPQDVSSGTKDGWQPLHGAASQGHAECCEVLFELGANVNAAANDGNTPALVASLEGRTDVLRTLMKDGADLKQANKDGWQPIHAACVKGHVEAVRFLVEEAKVDVNVQCQGSGNHTPMMMCILSQFFKPEILEILLKRGGADWSIKSTNGWNCLHACAQKDNYIAARILADYPYHRRYLDYNVVTPKGKTALALCQNFNAEKTAEVICERTGSKMPAFFKKRQVEVKMMSRPRTAPSPETDGQTDTPRFGLSPAKLLPKQPTTPTLPTRLQYNGGQSMFVTRSSSRRSRSPPLWRKDSGDSSELK